MATEEEIKETVSDWLKHLAADFYDEVIIKLVQCLDKCLYYNGNHAEKYPHTKLHGFSLRVNYTDQATAACRRS
jgi:hypothetical protein